MKALSSQWFDGLAYSLTKVEEVGGWPDGVLDPLFPRSMVMLLFWSSGFVLSSCGNMLAMMITNISGRGNCTKSPGIFISAIF